MNLANAINEDILQVDALGVAFIQLDEFTWANGFEDWAIPRDAAQLVAATCRTIELDEAFFEEVRLDLTLDNWQAALVAFLLLGRVNWNCKGASW